MKLPAPVQTYIEFFQTLDEQRLDELKSIYIADVHFRDPFNDVYTRDEVEQIFRRMFATCADVSFEISDACGEGNRHFLHWKMRFRPRSRLAGREPWLIEGVSRVLFADDGRVSEHIDFWDSGTDFYARLPLLGSVIRALRRRLG